MTRTLVTGATGTLGRELCPRLADAGHDVRAASRDPPASGAGGGSSSRDPVDWVAADLAAGTGIEAAVADVDVVVHAASDATGDSEAVDVRGTERLLEAASEAAVSNLLYVSIVGIDEMTGYSYYEHKLRAEERVSASDVPSTILRATQFHAFVDDLLGMVARLPIWPLPTKFQVQPVAEGEVAEAIVEHATEDAAGRVPDVGGPDVRTGRELATAYREARGLRRPIVRLPLPGDTASAFRSGAPTCPDRAVGTRTWEEWLAERYD